MHEDLETRGFLPTVDPLRHFPEGSAYALLDEIGTTLPDRLGDPDFRSWARQLSLPRFAEHITPDTIPAARLYYVRIGFLVSGFVNQIGSPTASRVPENLAGPLCEVCRRLGRPPILSYDGYALYNWYRLDPDKPVALGNIDTIQNFVSLYDEHWFILVHVEIEALAARALRAIVRLIEGKLWHDADSVNQAITEITETVRAQTRVLRRIPEKMSHELYFSEFRPYIRFFDNVQYEGERVPALSFRGETGAQSSIMPSLDAFFKIRHEPNALTRHVADMRKYMPRAHREWLRQLDQVPAVKPVADPAIFNAALEAIAAFREVHNDWAKLYVDDHVEDPRGTGGTPYMRWLRQLIHETRAHRVE